MDEVIACRIQQSDDQALFTQPLHSIGPPSKLYPTLPHKKRPGDIQKSTNFCDVKISFFAQIT